MKKPFLFFTIKCAVIIYFAACTGTDAITSAISATPYVTKGNWSVKLFTQTPGNNISAADGYTLNFQPNGKITATNKGKAITGNWSEDNILKRITIYLHTDDPALKKLNDYWTIAGITESAIQFQNTKNPSGGRLLLTSL